MTTDDERDLAQALFRTLYDAGVSFQSGGLIPRLTATVRAAGFRRQGPITPPSDDEAHPARFDRFLCADCGEPITTQRVSPTSTSEWWVHVSDLGPGRSAVPSTTEQEGKQ